MGSDRNQLFKYLRNVLIAKASMFAQGLSFLFLIPLIIKTLGTENFGVFALLTSFTSIFLLGNFGFPQAVLRKASKLQAEKNRVETLVMTAITINLLCLAVIAIPITFLILKPLYLLSVLHSMKLIQIFASCLVFTLLQLSGYLFSDLFHYLILARNAVALSRTIKFLEGAFNFGISYLILRLAPSVQNLVIVQATNVAVFAIIAAIAASNVWSIYPKRWQFDRGLVKEMLPEGMWYWVGSLSTIAIFQSDSMILSTLFSASAVGVYASLFKFADVFRQLTSLFSSVMFPKIVEYSNQKNSEKLKQLLIRLGVVHITIAIVFVCVALQVGPSLYRLWIGKVDLQAEQLLPGFVLFSALFMIDSPFSTFIGAMGIHKKTVIVGMLQGMINISLSLMLGHSWGLKGVIAASSLAFLITNFWFNPFYLFLNLKKAKCENCNSKP